MRRHAGDNKAFTIVELLVVIGVMTLLMGLLLPALGAAHRKGLKNREMSALRQVGHAWQLYAINNKEQVLPGFLDPKVQEQWQVKYQYPNHALIPPWPTYSNSVPNNAGPWTWRLMPNISYNHEMVHGHLDEPGFDATMLDDNHPDEVRRIAEEPAFGYNAMYVGGWWKMVDGMPRPWVDLNSDGAVDPNKEVNTLAVRSVGSIRRSSELVIFCSSTPLDPGTYRNLPSDRKGAHYVVPPWLANPDLSGQSNSSPQWTLPSVAGGADATSVLVVTQTAVPFGRYNHLAANLCADLHTETNNLQALHDMRRWIDRADKSDYGRP